MFIAFPYMFRANTYPSSGENTVPMRHLVLVILYRWQSRQSSIQSRYGIFSWWWAYSCPKHVEKTINILKKLCTKLVLFTRLYRVSHSLPNPAFL